ncbi:hypothetical protein [Streptomyces sp. NPDC057545]
MTGATRTRGRAAPGDHGPHGRAATGGARTHAPHPPYPYMLEEAG